MAPCLHSDGLRAHVGRAPAAAVACGAGAAPGGAFNNVYLDIYAPQRTDAPRPQAPRAPLCAPQRRLGAPQASRGARLCCGAPAWQARPLRARPGAPAPLLLVQATEARRRRAASLLLPSPESQAAAFPGFQKVRRARHPGELCLCPARQPRSRPGGRAAQELRKRRLKVPESEFSTSPEGLRRVLGAVRARPPPRPPRLSGGADRRRYYDVDVGKGALADVGERVVVHYEARWKGVTISTSRTQWGGTTGGQPLGFDVGAKGAGGTLPGLDLVRAARRGRAAGPCFHVR